MLSNDTGEGGGEGNMRGGAQGDKRKEEERKEVEGGVETEVTRRRDAQHRPSKRIENKVQYEDTAAAV